MGLKINASLITSALGVVTPFLATMIAGKGARYQSIAQSAIRAAVTTTENGVDHLVNSFKEYEEKNPVVEAALSEFGMLAKASGVTLPSVDVIQSHIKSAIYDLATTLVPLDQLTSASQSAPSTGTVSG